MNGPGFAQADDHPVVCVAWNDAVAFCDWLSEEEGRTYRLPTEAECGYCCRAGTTTIYPWGDNPDEGEGWAGAASRQKGLFTLFPAFKWSYGYVHTSPVTAFRPNTFGLYDAVGNALQWCRDWFDDYPAGPAEDPTGPVDGEQRILRGGGFVLHRGARFSRSGGPSENQNAPSTSSTIASISYASLYVTPIVHGYKITEYEIAPVWRHNPPPTSCVLRASSIGWPPVHSLA